MTWWWSWLLTAIGVFGLYLAGRKNYWGWGVGIAAQVLWIAYASATQQWGFYVSAIAYGWVYVKNLLSWRNEANEARPTPAAGDHGQSTDSPTSGDSPAVTTKESTLTTSPEQNPMPTLTGVVPPPPVHTVNEEDCLVHGHDYEHIVTGEGDLIAITCPRCKRAWRVEEV